MAVTINYKSAATRVVYGTWTHTEGTANESFTVAGFVYGAIISDCDSTGTIDAGLTYSISRSTTTGISTVTIHCSSAVTDGRFVVFTSSM